MKRGSLVETGTAMYRRAPGRRTLIASLRRRGAAALICGVTLLAAVPRSFADDTNAARISDPALWKEMSQIMGGVSQRLPIQQPVIRTPKGLYAVVLFAQQQAQAASAASTGLTTDKALNNLFSQVLRNPAVSGFLIASRWADLNPYDPTVVSPSAAYAWNQTTDPNAGNILDDAFNSVVRWNAAHPGSPPKTIQLVIPPGFNSPAWIFNHMTSCDGLFMSPQQPVDSLCGYTNLFVASEGGVHIASPPLFVNKPYPMPWSSEYKRQWRTFLTELNRHINSNPAWAEAFVSIAVAGVTCASEEMILPGASGSWQLPSYVALPPGVTALPVDGLTAWNQLFANYYGAGSPYLNSDRPFIEEWDASIDMFGEVFSGITLEVSTGPGWPVFGAPVGSKLLVPPPAFAPDCGGPAMGCAGKAAVLAYFAEPSVGGPNGKSTQEDGAIASDRSGLGLGVGAVKWLANGTVSGLAQLPGSPAVLSRMLAGLQATDTIAGNIQQEGSLPGSPATTPEQAFYNFFGTMLQGTAAGSYYGADRITGKQGAYTFTNAPINYLQLYWDDFTYAAGIQIHAYYTIDSALPQCTLNQFLGGDPAMIANCTVPASEMATRTVTTAGGDVLTAQRLLNVASAQMLGTTAEPAEARTGFGYLCKAGYIWRLAFRGDFVCVTPSEFSQVQADNAAAPSRYSVNDTEPGGVPYGWCAEGYVWRRASMGDYVCVTPAQRAQVDADNAAAQSRFLIPGEAKTTGPCSPAVTGSNNQFIINCQGITKQEGAQLLSIINQLLSTQFDLK